VTANDAIQNPTGRPIGEQDFQMMELSLSDLEAICMEMISYTGEGRAMVHEAIEAFCAEDIDSCRQKLAEAEKMLIQAHQIQFNRLLKLQAQGAQIPFHLLLIHAMDLLMISTSEKDVATKMLEGSMRRKGSL
jgi:cellobiose-specific phosphotransferase system component IIA